jgi:alkaline phosphatase
MKKWVFFLFWITNSTIGQSLPDFRIHSHNDYLQNVPFWKAFSAGATSIEADIFLIGEELFVAHTSQEIDTLRTFDKLYLNPLRESLVLGLERPKSLQLLIDIKSEPYSTLDVLIRKLKNHPEIIRNEAISIVISGNRPKPSEYVNYPDFIFFDYQSLAEDIDPAVLKKIALVSLSFKSLTEWNGKGRLTAEDLEKVSITIKKAHGHGKPFRFWATPDSKTAWKALVHLGVDFINTDMPFECANYLNTLTKREYRNSVFSEVYRPTFASDGKKKAAKNIILLIGDGNGLAQISATTLANKGELTLTQLRNIGFIKTQSSDDFTTDSAGGATAIATGRKVPNRSIGVDENGNSIQNITERLVEKGFISGVVTNDQITGATPSSFYAHQKDRGMTEEIKEDFLKSKLSVFVSAADDQYEGKNKIGTFQMQASLEEIGQSKKGNIGFLFSESANPTPLASAVKNVLTYLDNKNKPFFLMVEGAKIDSYGHANNIGGIIAESIAFDQAIAETLKFADTNKNTLVIVTADHETGGLTLPQGNVATSEIEGDFTTDDHTGIMVPVFAYGPRCYEFQGVYENNMLFGKILNALGVSNKY